jgi:hypothetical protein
MRIFGLACLAAVNPKLLGVDLILTGNRRPKPHALTHRTGCYVFYGPVSSRQSRTRVFG